MSVPYHPPFQSLKYNVSTRKILDDLACIETELLIVDNITVNENLTVTGTTTTTDLVVLNNTTTDTLNIVNVTQDDTETRLLVLDTATNRVEYRESGSLPHPTTTLTSAGGESSVQDGTGPTLVVKGFTSDANIDLTGNANDIAVSLNASITVDDITVNNGINADTIIVSTIPQDNTETRLVVLDTGTNQFEFRDVSSLPGSGSNPFDQDVNTNNSPTFQGLTLTAIPNDDSETKLLVLDSGTNALEYRNVSSLPLNHPFDQTLNTTDSPTFVGGTLTGIPQDDTNVKLLSIDGTTGDIEWVDKATLGGGGGNPFDQDLNTFDSPRHEFFSAGTTAPGNATAKANLAVTWDANPIREPPGIILEDSTSTGAMMHLWAEDQDRQAIYFSSSQLTDDNDHSSSVNSNYKIQKTATDLKVMGDSGKAPGAINAFSDLLSIDNSRILSHVELQADDISIPNPPSVNVSATVDVLVRNGTGPLETKSISETTLASAGGETLVNTGTAPSLVVKGLVAGTGIILTPSATDITLESTGGVATTLASGNSGNLNLVTDGVGPNLRIRDIQAGYDIGVAVDIVTQDALISQAYTNTLAYHINTAKIHNLVGFQTINSGLDVLVALPSHTPAGPTPDYQILGSYVTILVPGMYRFETSISWNSAGGATNGHRRAYWTVNNAADRKIGETSISAAGGGTGINGFSNNASFTQYFTISDDIRLFVNHSNGSSVQILGTNDLPDYPTKVIISRIR